MALKKIKKPKIKRGMTYLEKQYEMAAKKANEKLEQLRSAGLYDYNMQISRKWNVLLHDNTVKYVNAKTGNFKTKNSSSYTKWMSAKELRAAIATMTQFSSSRYTSIEYTESYRDELASRLGLEDDRLLSEVFRVFREFGFEGRYDSSNVLSNIAEFMDRTGRDDLANILDRFIEDYNAQMTADSSPLDTDILAGKISDLVANIDNGYEEDQLLTGADLKEIERLRGLVESSEPEVELTDEPVYWDEM